MLPAPTLRYILEFLCRDAEAAKLVGYTSDESLFAHYSVVIRPSNFFNDDVFLTSQTRPTTPLVELDGVPVLFGTNDVERRGQTIIISADLVASTFFFISRYEELVVHERDKRGRFSFKNSILSSPQLRHRAIVDEYGEMLRKWLGLSELQPALNSVTLTHDVDMLTAYRRPRGLCGGVVRCLRGSNDSMAEIIAAQITRHADPAFTFPFLFEEDARLPEAKKIYFIKAPIVIEPEDRPVYSYKSLDFKWLLKRIRQNECEIGLHTSYYAGQHRDMIVHEKRKLEDAMNQTVTLSRHHYLRTCSPSDFEEMAINGLTDDYTMGFVDNATFRLGTCRNVQWIHPRTLELRPLTLHPLTMMDITFSDDNCMGLNLTLAWVHAKKLVDITRKFRGDLTLLWHNNSFSPSLQTSELDQSELYCRLIEEIAK